MRQFQGECGLEMRFVQKSIREKFGSYRARRQIIMIMIFLAAVILLTCLDW